MDFVSSTFALRRLHVKCYAEVTQALKSFARTEFPNLLRLQKKNWNNLRYARRNKYFCLERKNVVINQMSYQIVSKQLLKYVQKSTFLYSLQALLFLL